MRVRRRRPVHAREVQEPYRLNRKTGLRGRDKRSHVTDLIHTAYGDYRYDAAPKDVRWVMSQADFDGAAGARAGVYKSAAYALHSRAAALLLAMGVPGPTVQKVGHWADPRALLTYDARDADVVALVSEAFQRVSAPARASDGASNAR